MSIADLYPRELEQCMNLLRYEARVPRAHVSMDAYNHYCGDHVSLSVWFDRGRVFLEFEIDGCLLAKGSALALQHRIGGAPRADAIAMIRSFIDAFTESNPTLAWEPPLDYLLSTRRFASRAKCVLLPWTLAHRALTTGEGQHPNDVNTGVDLHDRYACDACVAVTKLGPATSANCARPSATVPLEYQRLGKLVVHPQDIAAVVDLIQRADPDHFELLRRWRVASIAEYNVIQTGLSVPGLRAVARYEGERNRVQVDSLCDFRDLARSEGVDVRLVKGSNTRRWYPPHLIRQFNDMDVLVRDLRDFLRASELLVHRAAYQMVPELGMAMSLKALVAGPRIMLSGHAHFSKRVEGYGIGIDLAFPNLPLRSGELLRTGVWDDGMHEAEDLVLTSLAHVMKHSIPSIKDINDIYLLTRGGELDWEYLARQIRVNRLELRWELVSEFIRREYDCAFSLTPIHSSADDAEAARKWIDSGWPFALAPHHLCREFEEARHRQREKPTRRPCGSAVAPLEGRSAHSDIAASVFDRAGCERIYWIPLAWSKRPVRIDAVLIRELPAAYSVYQLQEAPPTLISSVVAADGLECIVSGIGLFYPTTRLSLKPQDAERLGRFASDLIHRLCLPEHNLVIESLVESSPAAEDD